MRLAPWPDLHRFVASLMLVAMTAFVLHGAAMAKAGAGGIGCSSSAGHVHPAAGNNDHHHVGAGHDHADHQHAELGDHDGHHGKGGSEAPCCGSACTTALPSSAPVHAVSLIPVRLTMTVVTDLWSGIDPNGLKRPPRPLCTA